MKEGFEQALLDLVAIAQRRKPGQVTHKIEDIKELLTTAIQEAVDQQHQELREKIEGMRQRSLYFEHGQRVEAYNDALDDILKLLT